MSYYHITTGTTYDFLPKGTPQSELKDIGARPSDWHYWNDVAEAWVEVPITDRPKPIF